VGQRPSAPRRPKRLRPPNPPPGLGPGQARRRGLQPQEIGPPGPLIPVGSGPPLRLRHETKTRRGAPRLRLAAVPGVQSELTRRRRLAQAMEAGVRQRRRLAQAMEAGVRQRRRLAQAMEAGVPEPAAPSAMGAPEVPEPAAPSAMGGGPTAVALSVHGTDLAHAVAPGLPADDLSSTTTTEMVEEWSCHPAGGTTGGRPTIWCSIARPRICVGIDHTST
jgi:hypothetical protein